MGNSNKGKKYAIWIEIEIYINTEDTYADIVKYVETRFDASNYELERPLPREKHKLVIGLIKNELGQKIMINFPALRPKAYRYSIDEGDDNKKQQEQNAVSYNKNVNLMVTKN